MSLLDDAGLVQAAEPAAAPTVPTSWQRTEIDGVPVFWMPGRAATRAGVVFRVGHADESLPTSGITRMCHRLVVAGQGPELAGHVGENLTTFVAQATGDELAVAVRRICELVSNPDIDDLEEIRSDLMGEDATRVLDSVEAVVKARYGPRGYGLVSYPDYGLERVRGENIVDWYVAWFVAENAVVWFDGEVPEGLELPLNEGERRPAPEVKALPHPHPAHVHSAAPFMTLTIESADGPELAVALEILSRRLMHLLRDRDALAYGCQQECRRLGAELDHISMNIDIVATRASEAVSTMLTVLHQLGDHGPEPTELEEARIRVMHRLHTPEFVETELIRAAGDELFGAEPRDVDDYRTGVEETTQADAHAAFRSALDSLVLHVPSGVRLPAESSTNIPRFARIAVDGTRYEPAVERRQGQTLIVGRDGVTISDGRKHETSLAKTCAAMLKWADGGRRLIDATGLEVTVEPAEWMNGETAVGQIDQVIPVRRHLARGTRLGVPEVSPERRMRPTNARRARPLVIVAAAVVMLAGLWTAASTLSINALAIGFVTALGAGLSGAILGRRLLAETSVGGRLGRPEVYDVASGSLDHDPQSPMIRAHEFLPGGTLLAWLINRGLVSPEFAAASEREVGRVRSRSLSGPELYRRWNGLLVSDMVDEEANEFLFDYMRLEPIIRPSLDGTTGYAFSFWADFWALGSRPPVGGSYTPSHAWSVFDRMSERIDEQFERWQHHKRILRAKRLVVSPPRFVPADPVAPAAPAPSRRRFALPRLRR